MLQNSSTLLLVQLLKLPSSVTPFLFLNLPLAKSQRTYRVFLSHTYKTLSLSPPLNLHISITWSLFSFLAALVRHLSSSSLVHPHLPLLKSQITHSGMHLPVFGIINFLPHSVNVIHHLSPPSHHPSLPLSCIPDLKLTCSTNPYHHRSSPTHRTAHWTSTGLPPWSLYNSAFCFIFCYHLFVDACVGLNWLSVVFLSQGNKRVHSFIHSVLWSLLLLVAQNNVSCCSYYAGENSFEVKTEVDSSDITEHSHDDKPRPYVCTVCDKRFTLKGNLSKHKLTHSGEKLHLCTQCGKRFSSQSSLSYHKNIHTGRYKCTECGNCYGNNRDLAVHRQSHSGEKPFECNVCSKRFTKSVYLFEHSRIHSGEKPYKCHLCHKAFRQTRYLDTHMRVHTREKPCKS